MSSTIGQNLKLSIWGQSHGPAIGVTIDGLPAGVKLDPDELAKFLLRRAPGGSLLSTPRREKDQPVFLSGLVDGVTCGAPLTAMIENTNTHSGDYSNLRDIPRPGHADFTAQMRYHGAQDVSGGGHFSGRLTAPLCIAGGICLQLLQARGIAVMAHIAAIGAESDRPYDPVCPGPNVSGKPFPVLDDNAGQRMQNEILAVRKSGDSVGGIIECAITGVPAGIGSPMFDGLENRLAQMLFGIPAVKGVEFGNGFAAAALRGSENNDAFCIKDGVIATETNRHGGILGGISSGMPIIFRVAIKPTPSIAQKQQSVSFSRMEEATLQVTGRHDPCIVPRAVPCVEAAAAITITDIMLNRSEL